MPPAPLDDFEDERPLLGDPAAGLTYCGPDSLVRPFDFLVIANATHLQ
jgi:hypothetical protein